MKTVGAELEWREVETLEVEGNFGIESSVEAKKRGSSVRSTEYAHRSFGEVGPQLKLKLTSFVGFCVVDAATSIKFKICGLDLTTCSNNFL